MKRAKPLTAALNRLVRALDKHDKATAANNAAVRRYQGLPTRQNDRAEGKTWYAMEVATDQKDTALAALRDAVAKIEGGLL